MTVAPGNRSRFASFRAQVGESLAAISLAICVLACLGAASAQPSKDAKASPGASSSAASPATASGAASEKSKGAVVIEHELTRVTFEPDGTGTREVSAAVRMETQAGVQQFSVLSFPYDSANVSLDVDYVRVRKPDGTVVPTPDYNIQDMTAEVTRSAPIYSDVHEKHVVVKALAVGDVLESSLRYRMVKPVIPGQFWLGYRFEHTFVCPDEQLQITVPRDKYVKLSSPNLPPEVKEDANRRTYSWKQANLHHPSPDVQITPRPDVQLTTFRSWEELGRWYDELQRPQIAVTPQIQARAAEITKGLTTDDEKTRALYNYVSTQFHYIFLAFGTGRYQPHTAEEVLENGYGDCKDKHTLLAALLKASGIEALPALMHLSLKVDPEVPSPEQFNHVVTYVPRKGSPLWLDTTPEVAPYGFLLLPFRDKKAFVIPDGKSATLQTTPANPPFPRAETFVSESKISPEGELTAQVSQSFRGDSEVLIRLGFLRTPPADWQSLVQRISRAQQFGGEVTNVTASTPDDTSKDFEFSYDYDRKELGRWSEHRTGAPLPPFDIDEYAFQIHAPLEPVQQGGLGDIAYTATVSLPVDIVKLPADVTLSKPYADYTARYSMNGRTVTVVRRLTIKQNEVPVDSWDDYKKFAKGIADDNQAQMELKAPHEEKSSN